MDDISPANQLAFLMRYALSMFFTQMDNAYVVFPRIEKKKSAGDNASHRVLKFLTRNI